MNSFSFNGVSSRTYGIVLSSPPVYNAPERDIESLHIPGRNGDLTIDNKCFKNIPGEFPISIFRDFPRNADAVRAWLCASPGYLRLEETYHPDEYRMARHTNGLEIDVILTNKAGEATITFDCMPQRWLKSGEKPVELTAPGTLFNPTLFDALPLITVTGSGSGTLTVNGKTIEISDIGGSVTLNAEIRRAYAGMTRRDYTITGRLRWLTLVPGDNTVSFSGGVSAVSIVPRWWIV